MLEELAVLRAGGDTDKEEDLDIGTSVLTELLGVAIIVFNLAFSFGLKRLEPWAEKKHPYIGMTMRVLYKELMSLGIIALVFTLVEISVHPSKKVVIAFEYAHIFLFMLAVMNIIAVGGTTYTSLRISRRWKKFQNLEVVRYEKDKQEYEELFQLKHKHNNIIWQSFLWQSCDIRKQSRFNYLHDEMNFHDLRIQFLHYKDLPPNFNFSKYLRHVKSNIFVELVEIAWVSWLTLLGIFVLDCVRRIFYTTPNGTYDFSAVIVCSWANAILCLVIFKKIKDIYWELTKHPGVYFDDKEVLDIDLDEDEKMIISNAERFITKDENNSTTTTLENGSAPSRTHDDSSSRDSRGKSRVGDDGPEKSSRREFVDGLFSHDTAPAPRAAHRMSADDKLLDPGLISTHRKATLIKRSGATTPVDSNASFERFDSRTDENSDGEKNSTGNSRATSLDVDGRGPTMLSDGGKVNKTIHERAMEVQQAREEGASSNKFLTFLIPRLKRRASPAEKLFWFGSHTFFGWLSQMTLLFSVILLTLIITDLIFDPPRVADPLYLSALLSALFGFIIVQIVLAFSMKKYTVVLNAAHLVEEELSQILIDESLRDTLIEDFDDDDSDVDTLYSEAEKNERNRSRMFFFGFLKSRV